MTFSADHHIHLFSAAAADRIQLIGEVTNNDTAKRMQANSASDLVKLLDSNGVAKALVLSLGYLFARPDVGPRNPAAISAENDWTADQAALFPDRLFAACSVNPLTEGALAEVDRCGASGRFVGLKMHLANSDVDLRSANHRKALVEIFSAANANGLAITVHVRTRQPDYGAADAQTVVEELLPLATTIPVHIAHMAGRGSYDAATDAALGVFASWAAANPYAPLYFDLAIPWPVKQPGLPGGATRAARDFAEIRFERLAMHIRTIGLDRVLLGTDWPFLSLESYLDELHKHVPLTADEYRQLERNVAPWLVLSNRANN